MPSSPAAWSAPRLPVAIAIALLLAGIVAALVVLIDRDVLRAFDQGVIASVRSEPLVAPLGWLHAATDLGATRWVAALAVVVGIVEIAAGRPRVGLAAAATIGLASLANSSLKLVVGRARPDELAPLVVEPGYSFPSGHSLSATVAYGVIAILIGRSALPAPLRAACIGVLALLVLVVGLSRVYLGAHYPTDVLGGWLTGLAWVTLFAAVSAGIDPRFSVARESASTAAAADPAGRRSGPPVRR